VLTAEKIIESIVVPSYPPTSRSSTSGVLTIVPVESVEKTVNPKSFVAYKSASVQSRNHNALMSLNFEFCSYNWIQYPCAGAESCTHVPDFVLALSHTYIQPGEEDAYVAYEKLFQEESGGVEAADTAWQALSRSWDKYVTLVLPFDKRPCPNHLCAQLRPPPPGRIKTITATGISFLGCSIYTAANRVSRKNASLSNVTDLSLISKWIEEKRYVRCASYHAQFLLCFPSMPGATEDCRISDHTIVVLAGYVADSRVATVVLFRLPLFSCTGRLRSCPME